MNEDKLLFNSGSIDDLSEKIGKQINSESSKLELNPNNAESALVKLVLSLVELIRKLVEKQAIRRVDGGSLTETEIECLGEALMKLELKMEELKKHFKLTNEDLNINLGPLGDLV